MLRELTWCARIAGYACVVCMVAVFFSILYAFALRTTVAWGVATVLAAVIYVSLMDRISAMTPTDSSRPTYVAGDDSSEPVRPPNPSPSSGSASMTYIPTDDSE